MQPQQQAQKSNFSPNSSLTQQLPASLSGSGKLQGIPPVQELSELPHQSQHIYINNTDSSPQLSPSYQHTVKYPYATAYDGPHNRRTASYDRVLEPPFVPQQFSGSVGGYPAPRTANTTHNRQSYPLPLHFPQGSSQYPTIPDEPPQPSANLYEYSAPLTGSLNAYRQPGNTYNAAGRDDRYQEEANMNKYHDLLAQSNQRLEVCLFMQGLLMALL